MASHTSLRQSLSFCLSMRCSRERAGMSQDPRISSYVQAKVALEGQYPYTRAPNFYDRCIKSNTVDKSYSFSPPLIVAMQSEQASLARPLMTTRISRSEAYQSVAVI